MTLQKLCCPVLSWQISLCTMVEYFGTLEIITDVWQEYT